MHYGYKMSGALNIPNERDSHIRAVTLDSRGNNGQEVDGSRCKRTLHYGYNSTCPQNIAREIHHGYKVREPGTYITSGIVI